MEGEYGMVVLDPKDGTWAETMEASRGSGGKGVEGG